MDNTCTARVVKVAKCGDGDYWPIIGICKCV